MNEEWWRLKDDDFKLLRGFWLTDGQTNKQTDICECRVAFVTEKMMDGDEYGDEGGGKGNDECGDA